MGCSYSCCCCLLRAVTARCQQFVDITHMLYKHMTCRVWTVEAKITKQAIALTLKEKFSTDLEILLYVSMDISNLHIFEYQEENKTFIPIDDDNRIALEPIPEADDCYGDYINACYIHVSN